MVTKAYPTIAEAVAVAQAEAEEFGDTLTEATVDRVEAVGVCYGGDGKTKRRVVRELSGYFADKLTVLYFVATVGNGYGLFGME